MTDKAIIEALKNGEPNALKTIYLEHKQAFMGFVKKFPISESTRIDIYQDAIIALRENAVNGDIDNLKSQLRTYLFSIGKYMIYDKLKQQNKLHLVDDFDKYIKNKEVVIDIVNNDELNLKQKQLQIAFKALGKKCKEVLTLFYYRGFDLEEITIALNYTNKDVVKSQKSRCLKTLKTLILKNKDG